MVVVVVLLRFSWITGLSVVVVVLVRFCSITGLSVVVVVFRITSPVLSYWGAEEQDTIVAIIIKIARQLIKTFPFFIEINPFCLL